MKSIFLKLIRSYQVIVSPFLGKRCRFYPSCSEYFYQAVKKYGLFKGFFQGLIRIIKCNPWNPGGVDLP
ncbi:MAG: membrane protein insertion efficiency factor YidD [Candidatus Nealsonbacteria bacterium]